MKTTFKPTLENYGVRKVYEVKAKPIKRILTIIAILPICSAWLFLVIPFVRDLRYVRFM